MNTKFTVTSGKGTSEEKGFTCDLGQDILAGKTDAEIRTLAERSEVIAVQGKLRKFTKASDMEAYLRKTYRDAIVDEGVEREVSTTSLINKAVAKHGKDKVEEFLNSLLSK